MPSGIRVAKPAAVRGNSLPERTRTWGPFGDVLVDTPLVSFFCRDGKWYVELHEYIPGPGPGDFRDDGVLQKKPSPTFSISSSVTLPE